MPKRSSYWTRIALAPLVVVVTSLMVEATVRARAPVLPAPQRWSSPEMAIKERQINVLERAGGASVVFFGSSHTDAAIDPATIDVDDTRRPVYNASLLAGSFEMTAAWSRRVVLPRLRPDVVVLGVSSREFNPHDRLQQLQNRRFFAAPAVRRLLGTESPFERAERRIESASALLRYRTFLRQPKYLLALFGLQDVAQGGLGTEVAANGHYVGWERRTYPRSNAAARYRTHSLRDFEIGRGKVDAFRRLVADLTRTAKRVIVLMVPETSDYVHAHPGGPADYHAYERTVRHELSDLDVEVVDGGVWATKYFADPSHVRRLGTERMGARMSKVLSRD